MQIDAIGERPNVGGTVQRFVLVLLVTFDHFCLQFLARWQLMGYGGALEAFFDIDNLEREGHGITLLESTWIVC